VVSLIRKLSKRRRQISGIARKRRLGKGKRSGRISKKRSIRIRKQIPLHTQTAPVEPAPVMALDMPDREGQHAAEVAAYDRGFSEGFGKGQYDGGEKFVDQLMPGGMVLPGVPVQDIIAAGLEQYRSSMIPVMGTVEVVGQIVQAMDNHLPLSVVRLGDGELLTMAQDTIYSASQIRNQWPFLSYAGVDVPDYVARDQLSQAVREATIVGIPLLRVPNFQHLAFQIFDSCGLNYRAMQLTHSTINYAIYLEHGIPSIIAGRKVLVIGNQAAALSNYLQGYGYTVVGAVSPVQGVHDIDRVMQEVSQYEFDIALVAAGIPAVIIVSRIATELGKVAIDFGHLADSMAKGEAPL
jgi:hypothetical protein